MKYNVIFTFGGCVTVDAENQDKAEATVCEMSNEELMEACRDGFEIQSADEID